MAKAYLFLQTKVFCALYALYTVPSVMFSLSFFFFSLCKEICALLVEKQPEELMIFLNVQSFLNACCVLINKAVIL